MATPASPADVAITINPADQIVWHALPDSSEVFKALKSSPDGLSPAEAAERLQRIGPNRLTPPKKAGFFARLWAQLNNVLIWILLAAAIVEGGLQEWPEFGLILGVVAINATIGMIQEGKAEKAAEAIKAMLSANADVVRGGKPSSIPAEQLVPGDVVILTSGDKLPADVRIVECNNFQVQEAMLTGESVPVSKNLKPVAEAAPLGDRKCMAFSATSVSSGNAKAVVVATGDRAEIGKINKLVGEVTDQTTNLTKQLEILGRWIAVMVLLLALLAFLLALLRTKVGFSEAFKSAVAIAVAIIPEGLPALVTIVLAIGTTNMARANAIIRQLPAVETLGSLTVICTDKTGTLTKNEMTVQVVRTASSVYKVTGVGYAPAGSYTDSNGTELPQPQLAAVQALMQGAMLCNDSALSQEKDKNGNDRFVPVGAPTEVALLTAGTKAGLSLDAVKAAKPRVAAVPFESEHKFMATVHQEGDRRVMYVKGASDRLLPISVGQVVGDDLGRSEPMDAAFWQEQQAQLSSQGLRVLMLCRAELPADEDINNLKPQSILQHKPFLQVVSVFGILDPPRPEAIEAVKLAHKAGIVVKMITGDHALTALAIGKMVGLAGEGIVLTGPEVDALSEEKLRDAVMHCNVYARASPENKIRIVRALQAEHQVVSMTGDGVNDAPALKAADVGVAMGITGTDVSKEAAKMVLADDNFASIVAAVKEGRRVWDNLKKILLFNLPVALAQGTCILWAYILGLDNTPLSAIQVLFLNLVTAVTMGLMLAAEPAEPDVMQRPPRPPKKRLFGKMVIWRSFFVSTILNVLILGMFYWGGRQGLTLQMRRAEAFNVLAFCTMSYSVTTRFLVATSFHPRVFRGNPWCWAAIGVTAALQVLLTYTPGLNDFFSMAGMNGIQWARVLVCMVVVYIIIELEKCFIDPIFMPVIKPGLRWAEKKSPSWLSVEPNPPRTSAGGKTAAQASASPSATPVPGMRAAMQAPAATPAVELASSR